MLTHVMSCHVMFTWNDILTNDGTSGGRGGGGCGHLEIFSLSLFLILILARELLVIKEKDLYSKEMSEKKLSIRKFKTSPCSP